MIKAGMFIDDLVSRLCSEYGDDIIFSVGYNNKEDRIDIGVERRTEFDIMVYSCPVSGHFLDLYNMKYAEERWKQIDIIIKEVEKAFENRYEE